ncbi:Peptidyl-prolyl cis-trans isomerase fpr2 [Actinomortierella ambigua]|nr:Peptidyl-prolyl cis-trans isomerase fpr2 [Actinomortierella ambigua]
MKFTVIATAALLFAAQVLAKEELVIEKTFVPEECKQKSKDGDKLSMHYTGLLLDGSKFDSSHDRKMPFDFNLGNSTEHNPVMAVEGHTTDCWGMVIKGWDQGLKDMCIGEKRKLTIPSDLAYGDRAMGPIPAKSTLIFDVELLAINGRGKDEL